MCVCVCVYMYVHVHIHCYVCMFCMYKSMGECNVGHVVVSLGEILGEWVYGISHFV